MKKWYRFLLALALAAVLTSLTACGNGAGEPQGAGDSQTSADVSGAEDSEGETGASDSAAADKLPDEAATEETPEDSGAALEGALVEEPPQVAGNTPASGENETSAPAEAPEKADTPAPAEAPAPEKANTPAPAEAPASEKANEPAPAEAPAQQPAAPAPQEAPPQETAPAGVSLSDVRDKMVSELGISDYMEVTAGRLLDLYGIEEADLKQSASFATMSGAFPGEIVLVEAVDADAAQRIVSLLQARLDEVLNQYKTYDAETYALAEACTIDTDGNFVSMLLSPERAEMRSILADSLR